MCARNARAVVGDNGGAHGDWTPPMVPTGTAFFGPIGIDPTSFVTRRQ